MWIWGEGAQCPGGAGHRQVWWNAHLCDAMTPAGGVIRQGSVSSCVVPKMGKQGPLSALIVCFELGERFPSMTTMVTRTGRSAFSREAKKIIHMTPESICERQQQGHQAAQPTNLMRTNSACCHSCGRKIGDQRHWGWKLAHWFLFWIRSETAVQCYCWVKTPLEHRTTLNLRKRRFFVWCFPACITNMKILQKKTGFLLQEFFNPKSQSSHFKLKNILGGRNKPMAQVSCALHMGGHRFLHVFVFAKDLYLNCSSNARSLFWWHTCQHCIR